MNSILKETLKVNKEWLGKAGIALGGFLAGAVLAHVGGTQKRKEQYVDNLGNDLVDVFVEEDEVIDIQPEEVE